MHGDVSQWGKIPHWGHIYILKKGVDNFDSFVYNVCVRYNERGVDNFDSFVYNVCVRYNERRSEQMAESRIGVHTHTHR